MILTYNKDKIYDPNTYQNVLRRSMKQEIRMNYIKRPINIPILKILFWIPGMKQLYNVCVSGNFNFSKLFVNKEQKEFLDLKLEEFALKK